MFASLHENIFQLFAVELPSHIFNIPGNDTLIRLQAIYL